MSFDIALGSGVNGREVERVNKRKKSRRKRWLKARMKTYRKVKFVEAFRNHFVKKGILDI